MKKLIACALASLAAAVMAPAAPAAVYGPGDMNIVFGPNGTISASFSQSGIVGDENGLFTDTYNFIIPIDGLASGSVTTSTTIVGSATDLDFTSVLFNGTLLIGVTGAKNEVVFANAVPILAGALNTLTINGIARGNGSYGGQGTFTPITAVPEPATWGLLLAGFGAVGYSMRSRKARLLQAV